MVVFFSVVQKELPHASKDVSLRTIYSKINFFHPEIVGDLLEIHCSKILFQAQKIRMLCNFDFECVYLVDRGEETLDRDQY